MAIYSYQCTKCEHEFDAERPMAKRRRGPKCEKCQGSSKLVIRNAAFHLKGTGWASSGYGMTDVGNIRMADEAEREKDRTGDR